MKIRQKIHKNRIIKILYKCYFYFTLGKAQFAKLTDILPEISAIIIIATWVFGIDLTQYKAILGISFIALVVLLTILGWFFKNSGLWEVEIEVINAKNHIEFEIYKAAKRINKKFNNIKLK